MESLVKDRVTDTRYRVLTGLYIAGTFLLFLFAIDLMTSALGHLSPMATESIIVATSNPFTGFLIGILITAMVQSSSTTTSMAVALVASGSISLEGAVPIIMGANVGTTITSTIVALGFIDKKKELRRALAVGTYHDFFNILTAVVLFPLEYYYGFLSGFSTFIADSIFHPGHAGERTKGLLLISAFGPVIQFLQNSSSNSLLLALLSFVLLFASIIIFRRIIARLLTVQAPDRLARFFFTDSFRSFFWGLVTTAAIRSSTVTTTLLVPLAARKVVSLRRAVPFIIGANLGTTTTAFLAALMNAESAGAIALAVAHTLFNIVGFIAFYPVPALREIPIRLAAGLGKLSLTYRLCGFVYVLTVFFFIPVSLVYFSRSAKTVRDAHYIKTDLHGRAAGVILSQFDASKRPGRRLGQGDNSV